MSKQLPYKIIDKMHTKFLMKIKELATLQVESLPLTGDKQEVVIDHHVISTETGIVLSNGASHYVVQFVQGQGYWDMDRIIAYQ
jgi:hypothetical protein